MLLHRSFDRSAMILSLLLFCACEVPAMRIYPCDTEGDTRTCANTCGDGTQTCKRGLWSGCVVGPVRFACSNTCGDGTRLCQDGKLASGCEVEPTRLPCSNTCGDGTRLCQNNRLADLCEVAPLVEDCSNICGPGTRTCADDKWQACTAPQVKEPKLTATIRDFHSTAPDMDRGDVGEAHETGIVATTLGSDDKPVYAHSGPTLTVSGPDSFNRWFRDVPGVNLPTSIDLPLALSNAAQGIYSYSNTSFFPIDGQLFGNESQSHNYAFTAEIATSFRYNGGEIFTFTGDDDVFVFINRTLAIDLGGVHSSLSQTVDLDAQARTLGIARGGIYSMHIFFAERHPIASDFVVETTISEFASCR
jgi:fibro-slime domain-containing protein